MELSILQSVYEKWCSVLDAVPVKDTALAEEVEKQQSKYNNVFYSSFVNYFQIMNNCVSPLPRRLTKLALMWRPRTQL